MVLPLALVAAGSLLTRGIAAFLPKVLPVVSRFVGGIIAKPVRAIGTTAAGLVGTGVLLTSPLARERVKEAPKTALEFGKKVGRELEKPKKERELTIGEGLKKAGIVGGVVAAVVGGAKIVKEKITKEKVLDPQDIIKVTPIEDITKPLGAVEKPKPVPKEKVQPTSIKNTFNPTIDIRLSKSRKFINQQVIVK